jgi:hypothetical protein
MAAILETDKALELADFAAQKIECGFDLPRVSMRMGKAVEVLLSKGWAQLRKPPVHCMSERGGFPRWESACGIYGLCC